MERMTLREAAQRTSRSITTLRRYIRSGRLHAEKRLGRFGPEYFLSVEGLAEAGLDTTADEVSTALAARPSAPLAPAGLRAARDAVPLSLYLELQMKHEQLLVQYGMVRTTGLRALEIQAELERKNVELEAAGVRLARLARESRRDREQRDQELRRARLELEGRALEIAALREKVRALEMLTRNAVTNESIEEQFQQVMDQSRRVDRLRTRAWKLVTPSRPAKPRDH